MSNRKIAIVDYQLGNLFSVRRAFEQLDQDAVVTHDPAVIAAADGVVLPGVGAFGKAMENIRRLGLDAPLYAHVAADKPLFGICLGLQLLFEGSDEFGSPKGLGIFEGHVRRLPVEDAPVPQIGWNRVTPAANRPSGFADSALKDTPADAWMYFVHSFYVDNARASDALSRTDYVGFDYTSSVLRGRIFATQFHPEKSAKAGLQIYRNWLDSIS
jgi:glutamine amidotransferase